MRISISLVAAAIAFTLTGCAVNPPFQPPPVATPEKWHAQTALPQQASWPEREWWRAFGDPRLEQLEQDAMAGNHDLKAAASRVDQARSAVRVAAANFYPTVSGRIGAERDSRLSGTHVSRQYKADVSAGYEVDVWGRLRSIETAAQADLAGSIEAQRGTLTGLNADVAAAYFQLAALGERIDLVRRTIEAAQRIDGVVDARYRAGAVSGLDRAQSLTNLANIRAGLPPLEQAREETLLALALLTGRTPGELMVQPVALRDVPLPAQLPAGLPSELLHRRPDLLQAEAALAAAHADVGAARAALFPTLFLTAEGGFASASLRNLLTTSSSFLTLGADLLTPIFQGPRLQANVDRARARQDELVQTYHQTVLLALRDVERALSAWEKLTRLEAIQEESVRQAQTAFELAEVRYRGGSIDAIIWLDAQTTWLSAQDALLQTRFGRLNALVALYRALGA